MPDKSFHGSIDSRRQILMSNSRYLMTMRIYKSYILFRGSSSGGLQMQCKIGICRISAEKNADSSVYLTRTWKCVFGSNLQPFAIVISADGPALCNPDLQMGK